MGLALPDRTERECLVLRDGERAETDSQEWTKRVPRNGVVAVA